MGTAIVQSLASIITWFAAHGLDNIIGKWIAYLTIAFEERASDKAKKSFSDTIENIKANSIEKSKAWDDWRKKRN